ETCLRFDIIAREHVSRAYALSGDRVQNYKQESAEALAELRQDCQSTIKSRGEQSRTRIRGAIKNAMQKIQDIQSQYTS
ncbi:MAG: hypothetical protein K2X27_20240, partial [Candidatus Obscuribacterales bacterium]|nr:hypothetical protein [Candidatus Obscuribacterales bacterium]